MPILEASFLSDPLLDGSAELNFSIVIGNQDTTINAKLTIDNSPEGKGIHGGACRLSFVEDGKLLLDHPVYGVDSLQAFELALGFVMYQIKDSLGQPTED